jgi:hypothetical protein
VNTINYLYSTATATSSLQRILKNCKKKRKFCYNFVINGGDAVNCLNPKMAFLG